MYKPSQCLLHFPLSSVFFSQSLSHAVMLQRAQIQLTTPGVLARLAIRLPHTAALCPPPDQISATSSPSFPPIATTTNLMRAYFANGLPHHARHLFDEIPCRDVVAFTTLISGLISSDLHADAWPYFRDMLSEGIPPNAHTISSILRVHCTAVAITIHGLAIKIGVDHQMYVANALVSAYASHGATGLQNAIVIFEGIAFKTEITWTTMIAGYLRSGDGSAALNLFRKMLQEDERMNAFSCSAALKASAMAGSLISGKQLHSSMVKLGFSSNVVIRNTLLNFYCRFKNIQEVNMAFKEIAQPDLISWNTMISFMEKANPTKALEFFAEMEVDKRINPNCFTFTSIAAACGNLGLLTSGEQLHATAFRRGFQENLPFNNSIIDMYAKCGKIGAGIRVFEKMGSRDIVSWTTMMMAYGSHGLAREAMELFKEMVATGEQLDGVVLLGLIMACSHAGLVDQGLEYFKFFLGFGSLEEQEIYGCLVDLLGRNGKIKEAHELVEKMPIEADEKVWRALLGACRIHGDAAVGKIAAGKIEERDPGSLDVCSLLCNILAGEGEWVEFALMRKKVKGRKEVGRSWVEINGRVSCFVAGDGRHPEMELVYGVVEMVTEMMKLEDDEICQFLTPDI